MGNKQVCGKPRTRRERLSIRVAAGAGVGRVALMVVEIGIPEIPFAGVDVLKKVNK